MHKQVVTLSHFSPLIVLLSVIALVALYGCSRGTTDKGEVVATVNKEPVRREDFQIEMALRAKQNPSYSLTAQTIDEQMNTIIDRRLMIQEAMKMGLAGNRDFVRTIQTFWEQTLIRELIEAKNKEWENRLFVTGEEIRKHYDTIKKDVYDLPPMEAIQDRLKKDILQQKKTEALEAWLKEVREKAVIEVNRKLLDTFVEDESQKNPDGQSGHHGDGDEQ